MNGRQGIETSKYMYIMTGTCIVCIITNPLMLQYFIEMFFKSHTLKFVGLVNSILN